MLKFIWLHNHRTILVHTYTHHHHGMVSAVNHNGRQYGFKPRELITVGPQSTVGHHWSGTFWPAAVNTSWPSRGTTRLHCRGPVQGMILLGPSLTLASCWLRTGGWSALQCVDIAQAEAGCCRQVAASHSDHYRQVLLYMILLDLGRLAAVDRWLPHTVTTKVTIHFDLQNSTCHSQVTSVGWVPTVAMCQSDSARTPHTHTAHAAHACTVCKCIGNVISDYHTQLVTYTLMSWNELKIGNWIEYELHPRWQVGQQWWGWRTLLTDVMGTWHTLSHVWKGLCSPFRAVCHTISAKCNFNWANPRDSALQESHFRQTPFTPNKGGLFREKVVFSFHAKWVHNEGREVRLASTRTNRDWNQYPNVQISKLL